MSARGTYDAGRFQAAYDKVMDRWPAGRETTTVSTPFGETHVNVVGPPGAPPLVLLPGGGAATSASWYAQAGELARTHRLHAVDLIGAPGRSAPVGDRHPRTVADLNGWLDALLDGLGIGETALGGHSYGAWIALHHALHAPGRIRRLFLLDPTQCFAGFEAAYLLRALPSLLRPTPRRVRAFLDWETGAGTPDPDWLALQEAAVGFPARRPVTGPRPEAGRLRGLDVPVLLLLAGNSRTHDPSEVATRARALLPRVEVAVLPDVSHHALPQDAPPDLGRRLGAFLTAAG
ncbi:carboxylesterase [Streptomyces ambofaciens]|uniref:Carboxylesterase n=1 Tax=Streptomyces ambofaciens TaxID=1889 RepID=A0ABN4P4D4_STRAM|nr:alpha/beta fold hydrolase [Streptomyces ambofaciens]ANB06060.1 carboxylesterase [Streptomyces ambofaciens]